MPGEQLRVTIEGDRGRKLETTTETARQQSANITTQIETEDDNRTANSRVTKTPWKETFFPPFPRK